jgi:hypothetical protein
MHMEVMVDWHRTTAKRRVIGTRWTAVYKKYGLDLDRRKVLYFLDWLDSGGTAVTTRSRLRGLAAGRNDRQ